jgi:hypothetical protein
VTGRNKENEVTRAGDRELTGAKSWLADGRQSKFSCTGPAPVGFSRAIGNGRYVHLGAQAPMCRTQAPPNLWHMALLLPLYLWMTPTLAADHVSAGDVRSAVAATPSGTLDLSGKDMSGDDLTDLDLSGANLTEANLSGAKLHGVKLVGANLTGADLTQADLTFAWIIRANFTHARLHSATMQTVVTSTGMDNTPDQAAIFVGTDLSDASITVHFSFDDMRGADFSHAHMTVLRLAGRSHRVRTTARPFPKDRPGLSAIAVHASSSAISASAFRWNPPAAASPR